MANLTLFLSDLLKRRMKKHPHIRWSSAIRSVIEAKLEAFEEAEALAAKSALTVEEAGAFARRVDAAGARRARVLLNENRR